MKPLVSAVLLTLSLMAAVSCGEERGEAENTAGWAEDIHWIRDSLPSLHYNLFMYVPRDSLNARLGRLENSLDRLNDQQITMELCRILASMKCSHTGIDFWDECDMLVYSLSVMWLDDGIFVTAADSDHVQLIGSRMLTYGGRPATEAASAMAAMFPATNDIVVRTNAENFLMLANCMEALGYGSTTEPVEFTFLTDSGDTTGVTMEAQSIDYSGMVSFHQVDSLPVWLSSDDCYWFKYLPQWKMLYCAYNSCNPMDSYPFADYLQDIKDRFRTSDVNSLVIDLRRNGGGNSLVAQPLIDWLAGVADSMNVHVSLIIGRWTFSSGILNAMDIARIPGVTVYGGRTGGSQNHMGEVKYAELPYSGLTVSYPSKYFQTVEGPGTTMTPDVLIPLAPGMLFKGEDSILREIYRRDNETSGE